MNVEEIEKSLVVEIEAIDAFLNVNSLRWLEIRHVLNILKSRDSRHYKNIKRKLFIDFRMVEDRQISDAKLDPHLDKAYELATLLESFSD